MDVNSLNLNRKRVRPIELQEPSESRRLWAKVGEFLAKGDLAQATSCKNALEKNQKRMQDSSGASFKHFAKSSIQLERNGQLLKQYLGEITERKLDINACFAQSNTETAESNLASSEINKPEANNPNSYWIHKDWI